MVESRAGENIKGFSEIFSRPGLKWIFLLVFGLMPINWWIEALKWRYLVSKVERISTSTAIRSLLAGLNLAIFTPARIGEYGGRILYLRPENRKKGTLCMLVGNTSQMVVTLLVGLTGCFLWIKNVLQPTFLIILLSGLLSMSICLLTLWMYFNIRSLEAISQKIVFLNNYLSTFKVLKEFSRKELLFSIIFSLGRYIVFSNQYIILLASLIGLPSYLNCFTALSCVFMAQSIIPSFILADLGIRGAISLFFIGTVLGKRNIFAILASTFYIWLINIIIPAIIGIYFVLKVKNPFGRT